MSAVEDRPIDRGVIAFEVLEVFRRHVFEAEDGLDRAVFDRVTNARHDGSSGNGQNRDAHARGFVAPASRSSVLSLILG